MESKNPDVEELLRYNKEGCKHEFIEVRELAKTVGAGGGYIGCHMEYYKAHVCKECHEEISPYLGARFEDWLLKMHKGNAYLEAIGKKVTDRLSPEEYKTYLQIVGSTEMFGSIDDLDIQTNG